MAHAIALVSVSADQIDSVAAPEKYALAADGDGRSAWQDPLYLISDHTTSTDLHLKAEDRQYLDLTHGIDAGTASTIWGDETVLDGGGA